MCEFNVGTPDTPMSDCTRWGDQAGKPPGSCAFWCSCSVCIRAEAFHHPDNYVQRLGKDFPSDVRRALIHLHMKE